MNQSFFTAAVGAHQQQIRLNVHGNNIANVNTQGFKAGKTRFQSLMYDNIKAVDDKMLPCGVGAALAMTSTDFRMGGIAPTGQEYDYAIEGNGFFVLTDLQTGEISLTRTGSFMKSELLRETEELDEYGQPVLETIYYLSDGQGRFVLSETGTMIELDDSTRPEDLPVGIFDYINYDSMQHNEHTRFFSVEKNGNIGMGSGKLIQGALEMSNVDLAEELTKVIESQRAYSMALKMVQTSDEIETTINGLRG